MYRRLILGLTAAAAMVGFIGVGATSASAATTWVKTANTTQNAYSVNGYKAKVGPSATPAVTGYSNYSKTVSIKTSAGTYVAKGVSSKWLSKGTYKVYSTFKYRKKVAYQTTVTKSGTAYLSDLDNATCTLTALTPVAGWTYSGTAKCTGTHAGHSASGTVTTDYIDLIDGANSAVGDTFVAGDNLFYWFTSRDNGDSIKWSYKAAVTKYKYVYKNRYRYRYVTVKKIYNSPTASWAEYKAIKVEFSDGIDSLSRVRAIIGSNGTRTYFSDSDGQTLSTYEWKNSSGGTVNVSFDDGRAYTKSWYNW